jgi:NAD(P)-dependent dehydrogenase (short-subunit alcohol dehydrogenase family)
MGLFDGKVAVITGASSGIGKATALAFAREGARVVIADIADAGQDTAREIGAQGGAAHFVRTDVRDPAQAERMVAETVATYGRMDIAFNNAGVGSSGSMTADYALDEWERVIGINLTGVWLCMRAEIPAMLANGGGVIINNASILGLVGFRTACAYVASKHAVLGLTKTAALEYAQSGIRVNAVCPGFIHTPMVDANIDAEAAGAIAGMHAMGRMGEPDEIASAVLWLASPTATFVTGQALTVDGGYTVQ